MWKEFVNYLKKGQKFLTNRFVKNFIQPTYKSDMCPLNMWETLVFFINTISMWKIHFIKTTCVSHMPMTLINIICGLYEISYKQVCRKFLSLKKYVFHMIKTRHFYRLICKKKFINQFVRNLCSFYVRCGQCHKKN
jgi:hypothetical protein